MLFRSVSWTRDASATWSTTTDVYSGLAPFTVATSSHPCVLVTRCNDVERVVAFYWLKGEQADWVRWAVFAGALVLGLLTFAVSEYGRGLWKFVLEARIELYKVFWPTREETGSMTIVVFGFVLIMSFFFWGVDTLLGWATRSLLGSVTGTGG